MNALLHAHVGRELVGWLPRPLGYRGPPDGS
jgi:hypothetical protein